jgi:hypothetical protein
MASKVAMAKDLLYEIETKNGHQEKDKKNTISY